MWLSPGAKRATNGPPGLHATPGAVCTRHRCTSSSMPPSKAGRGRGQGVGLRPPLASRWLRHRRQTAGLRAERQNDPPALRRRPGRPSSMVRFELKPCSTTSARAALSWPDWLLPICGSEADLRYRPCCPCAGTAQRPWSGLPKRSPRGATLARSLPLAESRSRQLSEVATLRVNDLAAIRQVAHFGIGTEVSDQDDLA